MGSHGGQCADLHPVQVGVQHRESDGAGAEHGVLLAPRADSLDRALAFRVEVAGRLVGGQSVDVGEELVQRRIEDAGR